MYKIYDHTGPYRYISGGRIDCMVQIEDGSWHQCVVAPDDENTSAIFVAIENNPNIIPEPYEEQDEPFLTKRQWNWMLAVGGLRTPIKLVLDAMDQAAVTPEERLAFANLEDVVLYSNQYRLSNILSLVDQNKDIIEQVLGSVPTEQQISEAFYEALEV